MWGSAKAAPALCLPREWGCRDPVCPPALQDVPPPSILQLGSVPQHGAGQQERRKEGKTAFLSWYLIVKGWGVFKALLQPQRKIGTWKYYY